MTALSAMGVLALEMVASLVAPARCAGCDARVRHLTAFCPDCLRSIHRDAGDEANVVAAFAYGGAVARAVARLKYEGRPDLARPLGDLLWRAVERRGSLPPKVIVVPVPLHPSRLAQRGFNQSALIARRVARALAAPMLPLALARTRSTAPQAELDQAARSSNVAGAFRVREPERIGGKGVLLVDDVRTTGATMNACAFTLQSAGAASVTHAVVARVQPDGAFAAPAATRSTPGV